MCTSIVRNADKTIVGWNLDILDMEYRVTADKGHVFIEIHDDVNGWLPLFGANARGDFVAMPTCWPYDDRSEPNEQQNTSIMMCDINLLLEKTDIDSIRKAADSGSICSLNGVTFMAQLSDRNGSVLQIVPGQGSSYLERPKYSVLTNFSPYKGYSEQHPWMGRDRYEKAVAMLEASDDSFDVADCFEILKQTAQTVCPTVVSMVYDAAENTVYWCEQQHWDEVRSQRLS